MQTLRKIAHYAIAGALIGVAALAIGMAALFWVSAFFLAIQG